MSKENRIDTLKKISKIIMNFSNQYKKEQSGYKFISHAYGSIEALIMLEEIGDIEEIGLIDQECDNAVEK